MALTVIATSLRNLSIVASQPALLATPKSTEDRSEVEWVRAELPCVDDSDFSFRLAARRGLRALPFFAIGALRVSRYAPRMDLRMKPMSAGKVRYGNAATKGNKAIAA